MGYNGHLKDVDTLTVKFSVGLLDEELELALLEPDGGVDPGPDRLLLAVTILLSPLIPSLEAAESFPMDITKTKHNF